ncbi:MAG TPA: DNA translocase FtsK [Firmicutes bacterium]|nr:DNA translocase FtsK [Bacillota bacterium]
MTGFLWWIFGKTGTFIFLSLVLIVSILGIGRKPLLDRIGFYFTYLFLPKGKKTEKKAEKAKKRDLSGKKKDRRKKKKATGKVELSHVATSKELADAVSPDKLGKTALENRPTLDLLNEPKHLPNEKQRDRSQLVADTLASFGVEATITGYVCGPTLTRYELMPGSGVKVKQIENLADDLALALAAPSVRIEAPIPGKRAVGIEVPNETPGTVYLKEVLNTPSFIQGASPLLLGVGKDISGQSVVADLKKLIHLLIAGSTGSGKSVCINSMLVSLLIKATPEELRLLLIDPKRVELALYEGIPHLLTPVVTDPKEAAKALRWAVMEMEERYLAFEEAKVRDLTGYNEKAKKEGKEILPCIVIVIDELADLMMVASAEVEEAICRLAQKARAAGMHLIVATQRPSTDVVTGLIKANIPSRIAFAVSSGTDSSIILDMRGAEKLLGKGDMLFYPIGLAKPVRLQGAFVSDSEVNAIVDFWKNQGDPDYVDIKVEEETQRLAFEAKDELLPQAARLIVENQRASASFLQRHLRIGYTRAARLIDIMETLGIVGPHQGSKPRDLLVDESELEEILQDY